MNLGRRACVADVAVALGLAGCSTSDKPPDSPDGA
jgi:hypothetical protein